MHNNTTLGATRWVIAEGYIPPPGPHGGDPTLRSHETACLLNANTEIAHVSITIYFSDREPVGPFKIEVPAQRTLHLRFDELKDPQSIPRETDYASVFESDLPIVVQHTRLDGRLGSLALMTTLAFPAS